MASYLILLTICLPWLGGFVVWQVGDRHARAQHILASTFSIFAGIASVGLAFFSSDVALIQIPMGNIFGTFTLVPDGLGVFLAMIATIVGSLAVIFSINYMQDEEQLGRYYSLILLFIGAMAGLGLSGSLLFMFFFWEITAFCSYALISFHNDDPKAVAGGIKALIVTQLGGVGLLGGALISYATLGSYQIRVFLQEAKSLPAGILAVIAFGFLAAAVAKSAQVPLHTWLPDAMEAPTPVTALIHAATMVNAGVYLLARFYPAFEGVPGWGTSVVVIGFLSALLAAVMALVATDLKRVLAYSTISQLGYMVYAIGVGAVYASQFHLLSHAVFKALLFLSAGAVIHSVGTRNLYSMGGLKDKMPFVRTVFIIGALALAGLPFANGFFSKELILEDGFKLGPRWAYWCMLIGAGITALYTVRMISLVFYNQPARLKPTHDAPTAMRVSLTLLALGTFTTWLFAGPLSEMLNQTMPFHEFHHTKTIEMVGEIFRTPETWLVLLVVLMGILIWRFHTSLQTLAKTFRPIITLVRNGMGFDWFNTQIVRGIQSFSTTSRLTQTGYLNWNIAGIIGGLVLLLIILAWGT